MVPKVEGPWDIHYVDQLLAQFEARHQLRKPILIHAILETAEGVKNVEAIATASPRMHGMSLGPADLAASRAMKTTRVGGGHPEYKVIADPSPEGGPRAVAQQDLWHYTLAKMVDACAAAGIKPFYGPFGDFSDAAACEAQFRNAFLLGCAGAWTLHPSQIDIAKRVFSPDPAASVRLLRQYSVDGVVVASSTLPPGFAKAFRDASVPVVHSFGRVSNAPYVHVVGIDNVECGRIAARTLLSRGYRKLGFLGGPERATSTQDRIAGFFEVLEGRGDVTRSHSFADAYSFDAGRKEMMRLLRSDPADAYFCGDDVLSIGALSAIKDNGLRVPDDIGILGLNDMEMSRWQNINLTTIHQPIQQIVASSIELMVTMMDEPDHTPEARIFPCHIVERGTLRPVPKTKIT